MATIEQQELYSGPSDIPAGLKQAVEGEKWDEVGDLLGGSLSCEDRQWAVETAGRRANESALTTSIIPHCDVQHSDVLLVEVMRRDLWSAADVLMTRGVSDTQRRWAVEEASRRAVGHNINRHFLRHCSDAQIVTVMKEVLTRKLWDTVTDLLKQNANIMDNALLGEVVLEASEFADEFWLSGILPYCPEDQLVSVFRQLIKRNLTHMYREEYYYKLNQQLFSSDLCDFCGRYLAYWLVAVLTSDLDSDGLVSLINLTNLPCDKTVKLILNSCSIPNTQNEFTKQLSNWSANVYRCCRDCGVELRFERSMFEAIFKVDFKLRIEHGNIDLQKHYFRQTIVHVCALQQHNTDIQSDALYALVHRSLYSNDVQWEIVSKACIWGVREEVRRSVFHRAVEKKQWSAVEQMGDHSLYDDQRGWAIQQARQHQQWEVIVRLAEHGLTATEEERAHREVIRHAAWDKVLSLLERGNNLSTIITELKTFALSQSPQTGADNPVLQELQEKLIQAKSLRAKWTRNTKTLEQVIIDKEWGLVLFELSRTYSKSQVDLVTEAALQTSTEHVLVSLVRSGLDEDQRDCLFTRALDRQLWGVARALLEHGVSQQLALDSLTHLEQASQWILVARVMEHDVGDDLRRKVMWEALDQKEGSLVAHVISCMEGGLVVADRETVFQRALDDKLWQVVCRLVEERDGTGAKHGDKSLLPAIQNRQWSVVWSCVRHGADIDKRNNNGLTSLQQAVEQYDIEAVKELLHLGADQFVCDMEGRSVLHMAMRRHAAAPHTTLISPRVHKGGFVKYIPTEQIPPSTEILKMLVTFHGDINMQDPRGDTPLSYFVCRGFAELIDCALDWGREVHTARGSMGETVLHAVCQAGRWKIIRYVVGRKCSPLAVTKDGCSCLVHACDANTDLLCQTLSACIQLGMATHQPEITDQWYIKKSLEDRCPFREPHSKYEDWSPLQALAKKKTETKETLHMLYEAGSCSQRELFRFYRRISLEPTEREQGENAWYPCDLKLLVKPLATNPRRLVSLCRLVMSHQLGVSKPRVRKRKVRKLELPFLSGGQHVSDLRETEIVVCQASNPSIPPVTVNIMKTRSNVINYLLFSDILHPDVARS